MYNWKTKDSSLNNLAIARIRCSAMLSLIGLLSGCAPAHESPVPVLYASVDPPLARAVLERSIGEVRTSFDVEANKTAGLVARLSFEREAPRADVFWNGEVARTIELCHEGVLTIGGLRHLAAGSRFADSRGCWIGFAARARVLVVPSNMAQARRPSSIVDLVDPNWHGRVAIADPHFGTTGTHFSALLVRWGEKNFRDFIRKMRANNVKILPGNAQVKDAVAQRRFAWGLTDTDDVHVAMLDGAAVEAVFPDQDTDLGLFLIPNTVALVANGPHSDAGRALAEYLASPEVEAKLAADRGAHIPIRHNVPGPPAWPDAGSLRRMNVSFEAVADAYPAMLRAFDEEWPQ